MVRTLTTRYFHLDDSVFFFSLLSFPHSLPLVFLFWVPNARPMSVLETVGGMMIDWVAQHVDRALYF